MEKKQGKLYQVTTERKILGSSQGKVLEERVTQTELWRSADLKYTAEYWNYHLQVRKLTEARERMKPKNYREQSLEIMQRWE